MSSSPSAKKPAMSVTAATITRKRLRTITELPPFGVHGFGRTLVWVVGA
jgi:hypothetical protein